MLLKYTPHFNAHSWHAALRRGARVEMRRQRAVRVTYIDRQGTKRQLSTESHTALVRLLGAIPGVELKQARMETLPFDEQLAIMRSTDVLIGVHGNGLTQQMFMSPRRYVVEIFPRRSSFAFRFDYSLLAKLMGHEHLLIFNGTQASLQLLTHDLVLASTARERQERMAERQRAALLAAGGTAVSDSAGQRAIGLRSKAESKAPMNKVERLPSLVPPIGTRATAAANCDYCSPPHPIVLAPHFAHRAGVVAHLAARGHRSRWNLADDALNCRSRRHRYESHRGGHREGAAGVDVTLRRSEREACVYRRRVVRVRFTRSARQWPG